MKKYSMISVLLLAVLLVGILTGCGCKHEWKEATCTEPSICSLCGKEEGEPRGHSWLDPTCEDPKTCRRCGKTKGEPEGHEWAEATCAEPKTCTVCAATEGKALGHTWEGGSCTEAPVCSVCGETSPEVAEHTWLDATCQAPKTCEICGLTEGEPAAHTEGESTLADYDLVEAYAVYETVCTVCGETVTSETLDMPRLHNDGYFLFSVEEYWERLDAILAAETDLYSELYINENMDNAISCDIWPADTANKYYAYSFFHNGNYELVDSDRSQNLYFNEIWTILDCVSADEVFDASCTMLAMLLAIDPTLDVDSATDLCLDLTEDGAASYNGVDYALEVKDAAEVALLFTAIVAE